MKQALLIVVFAMLPMSAEPQGQAGARPTSTSIVEVVGCLVGGPENSWALTNATEPVVTKTAGTTVEAVKAAEAKPLGKARYALIGLSLLNPAPHTGHKMAVKGLIIKDSKEVRINVTSFQMAGATCAR
jgi:hypothetical protein